MQKHPKNCYCMLSNGKMVWDVWGHRGEPYFFGNSQILGHGRFVFLAMRTWHLQSWMGVPHVGCVMLRRQLHGYIKPSQRQADSHHLDHPDPASKLMFSHHVGSRLAMPFGSFNMGIENKQCVTVKGI